MLLVGCEVFAESAPADVVEAVFRVHERPEVRDRVIALDWGIAAQAPPAVDFAWYLYVNGWRIDATREQLIDDFRAAEGDLHD